MRRMLLNISGIQRFFLLFKGFNNFLYYNISNYFEDCFMQILLRQLTISARLWSILCIAIIALALVSFLAMKQERSVISEQKNLQLSQLLELAHNTLDHFYIRYQQGVMSEIEAKNNAFNVIRDFRFTTAKDNDYFFILDKQGLAVMHPDKNLEKTNMRERRDPQGFAFIQDILKKSNQVNQGRTKYTWNKNGFSDPVLKLVRFKNFQPWDLVIVNGIYLDTVRNLMWEHAVKFIIIFIISIFSMASLIFLIIN